MSITGGRAVGGMRRLRARLIAWPSLAALIIPLAVIGFRSGSVGASGPSAVAVGEFGLILTTNDGGTTWVQRNSGTSLEFFRVNCPDPVHCFASAMQGFIDVTTDGGVTWTGRPTTASGNMEGISFPVGDDNDGITCGQGGVIFTTSKCRRELDETELRCFADAAQRIHARHPACLGRG